MHRRLRVLALLVVVLALSFAGFTRTASAQTGSCDTTGTVNGSAVPVAGVVGDTITFRGTGFTPRESVSFWFTLPNNGGVFGTPSPITGGVNSDGSVGPLPFQIPAAFGQVPGRWAITFQGTPSNHQAIVYFCVGFRQAAATATSVPATATSVPATSTAAPATATTEATATTGATATTVATVEASPTTAASPTTVAASPTTAEATPTSVPTAVVPPTEVPTVAPLPTETPMGGGVVTPGMPSTGQPDTTPMAVILLVTLVLLGLGLFARRAASTR